MSCQISWSSPEEEPLFKPMNQPKQWRKFLYIHTQPKAHDEYLTTPEKIDIQGMKTIQSLVPSPCNLIDLEDSPIIGTLKLDESPLLKEFSNSASPVIGKKRKRRHKTCTVEDTSILKDVAPKSEIKKKIAASFEQKFQILECSKEGIKIDAQLSPDVFSGASPVIEITDSPVKTQYLISQVNSQKSSIVIESATISPQSKAASLDSLYYQIPEKTKKRFKRGGLASQVQKHLTSERANVAIWKHENYLCKNGEYSISPVDEHLILSLKIEKLWDEFEVKYALCCDSDGDERVVLINKEYVDVNKLEIGSFLQIFPPYSEHTILFNKKDIKCYINVTRLKKSDAVI